MLDDLDNTQRLYEEYVKKGTQIKKEVVDTFPAVHNQIKNVTKKQLHKTQGKTLQHITQITRYNSFNSLRSTNYDDAIEKNQSFGWINYQKG